MKHHAFAALTALALAAPLLAQEAQTYDRTTMFGTSARSSEASFAGGAEERRARLLQEFDADGDGQLSEAERQTAALALKERRAQRRQEMMARFDSDGDGQLSDAEREAARAYREANGAGQGRSGNRRQRMLERFDADGDGQLSDAERQAARAAHQARRAEREASGEAGPERRGPMAPGRRGGRGGFAGPGR